MASPILASASPLLALCALALPGSDCCSFLQCASGSPRLKERRKRYWRRPFARRRSRGSSTARGLLEGGRTSDRGGATPPLFWASS